MSSETQMDLTRAVAGALVIVGFFIPGTAGFLVMAAGSLLAAFNIGRRFETYRAKREGSANE